VAYKDPQKAKEYRRNYSLSPVGRAKEAARRKNPKVRVYQTLYRHGMTPADYDWLLLIQGNACAVCRLPTSKRLYVDHNHETGNVRGLLCQKCNLTLGHVEKVLRNPLLAESFKKYLASPETNLKHRIQLKAKEV
jgi:hypothetical protein